MNGVNCQCKNLEDQWREELMLAAEVCLLENILWGFLAGEDEIGKFENYGEKIITFTWGG